MFNDHLQRLRDGVYETYSLADIPDWICKYTKIKGKPYSFKDHEFQEFIIRDPSEEVNVQKCSQVGLSEVMARWSVGACCVMPDFGLILTMPFSGDIEDFCRTRINPFLDTSEKIQTLLNQKINNSEMKMFGSSLMYFRGTNGKTQAISTPADCIVSDEVDRSDPHILTQFTSRVTHSHYRLFKFFGTPTVKGMGIDKRMETSIRKKMMCKCNHCDFWFLPDFFEHVKIPGYDNSLMELTKHTLPRTRYNEAYLQCPKCHGTPSLQPEYREYVVENNGDVFPATGYFVSPFDAPNVIDLPFLFKAMVKYHHISEFINQNLGLTSENSSESMALEDINAAIEQGVNFDSAEVHMMGVDMGATAYITVGRMTQEGHLIIVHRSRCLLANLDETRVRLKSKYRVVMEVLDSQPYTDYVFRAQKSSKNVYGARYSTSKMLELMNVRMYDAEADKGRMPIHYVEINRDLALDMLMGLFKNRGVHISGQTIEEDELYAKCMLDMKRIQSFNKENEMVYTWVKSEDGTDHYHHSTLYLWIACQMRGVVAGAYSSATGMPLMTTVQVQHYKQAQTREQNLADRPRSLLEMNR